MTVLTLEPAMPLTSDFDPRDARLDQIYDESLRKAFALDQSADVPPRLRLALDALRRKGAAEAPRRAPS